MLKLKLSMNLVFPVLVLILTGCSTSAINTTAQVASLEDFSLRVSQLEVGDEVYIMTVKREDFELEITEVGSEYVEGYAYYSGSPAAEWWPTRHHFKDIKTLDGIIVPTGAFPTLVATKKDLSGFSSGSVRPAASANEIPPDIAGSTEEGSESTASYDNGSFRYQLFFGKPSISNASVHSSYSTWFNSTSSSSNDLPMESSFIFGFRGTNWSALSPYSGVALEGSLMQVESSSSVGDSASATVMTFSTVLLFHGKDSGHTIFSPYGGMGFGVSLFSSIDTDLAPVGSVGGLADMTFFPDLRAGVKIRPFKSNWHLYLEVRYAPMKLKYKSDFNITDAKSASIKFDVFSISLGIELPEAQQSMDWKEDKLEKVDVFDPDD